MRLSISNIAWDVSEDEGVAKVLAKYGVDAIDIAPGKYFPDPVKATDDEVLTVKRWWADHGIDIIGMQALLFGSVGLNLFASAEVQESMLLRLGAVCRIASGLGASRLVFGSPKNRDRYGLTDQQTMSVAVPFFRRLGDIACSYGVFICLEPNPICYGANFMTTSAETAQVVKEVAHPGIRMQFDAGALTINCEDVIEVLQNGSSFIGHIHASEPEMLPIGDGGTDHAAVAACLKQYLPDHIVSIEMLATKNESHLISIERSLNVTIRHYRKEGVA